LSTQTQVVLPGTPNALTIGALGPDIGQAAVRSLRDGRQFIRSVSKGLASSFAFPSPKPQASRPPEFPPVPRVRVRRPNPEDLLQQSKLPMIAQRLADPKFAEMADAEAAAARLKIELIAIGSDFEGADDTISFAAAAMLAAKIVGNPDPVQASAIALGGLLARIQDGADAFGAASKARAGLPEVPSGDKIADAFGATSKARASADLPEGDKADIDFDLSFAAEMPKDVTRDDSFEELFDELPLGSPAAPARPMKSPPVVSRARSDSGVVVVPESAFPNQQFQDPRKPQRVGSGDFDFTPYANVAGKMLPCINIDDPVKTLQAFERKVPHLTKVAARLITETASRPYVFWRPLLLIGKSGSGKTRFAQALCDAMGVHSVVYPCGGISDSSFGGTSRQWSTMRTSVPLQAAVTSQTANPCMILDEIARCGSGRHNGNFIDLILGLTEPGTAKCYFDLCLESPTNLSRVLWIATSNDIEGVPQALLDRFRKVEIDLPSIDHAPALIRIMAAETAEAQGLDPIWAYDFSDGEIDTIANHWGGGSLRRLRTLTERAIDILDKMNPVKLN
jgi:hypothetical protein